MVIRKALFATVSAGLIFGSTAAAAAPAAVGDARSASSVADAEGLSGFGWILGLLIAAGVIAVIASDDDDNAPVSP